MLLISGIGVTPIPALLKQARKSGISQDIYLFYSNRTEAAAAYHDQLQTSDDTRFHYLPVFTASQPRINSGQLRETLETLDQTDFYIIGHHDFLASMQAMLADNDVPRSQVFVDDFG